MKNKMGMMVICGNSIAELEADLQALKTALATGSMMACGGRTLTETEKALNAMRSAMGAVIPSTARCEQGCSCHCCNCEEEYEGETCPNCGSTWYEDGECEDCGYSEDDLDGELDEAVIGYRWYVCLPNGEEHEPVEETYASVEQAYSNGIAYGYSKEYIGVDKVRDDDGSIDILEKVIKPTTCIKLDDEETAYEELPSMMEALEALASGDMDKVIAIARQWVKE